ncbi:glycosyltransferase family 2 protein [Alkalibacter mobilis]|uniref:glycosyltransferase family 2 protein n=1 Tax=Alkalibacter mobilis TaxID=2787712 RepID=UPI00189D1FC6|nr:glycosyltransferase family 2 protein [Alkalibacter mobilis]MBF7096232.1 glycosyltransferase family 2 protein [Alkalibacter mobilis]
MDNLEISLVIPVYNSEKTIAEVVERSKATLGEFEFEIILVNDHSSDKSIEIIKELEKKDPRVMVVDLRKNIGQQGAIKRGIELAKGNYVITMDDDLEQKPEEMTLLIQKIQEGFDVVYGRPCRKGYPSYREFGSKLVDGFFTLFMGKPPKVKVGSFRIMNRRIAETIAKDNTQFVYITAIILGATKDMANVPVSYKERPYGKSNYSLKKLGMLFVKLFFNYGIKKKLGSNSSRKR